MRFAWLAFELATAVLVWPSAARASDPPAWPVRFNACMPLGNTYGRERVHGFTWGFRGSVLAYPGASGRGVGAGAYVELLNDARTRSMSSLGATASAPLLTWEILDWRIGGSVGSRSFEQEASRRLAVAATTELVIPAWVYDFRLGLRADSTIDGRGVSATSLLVEVDVAVLLAALAAAAGPR